MRGSLQRIKTEVSGLGGWIVAPAKRDFSISREEGLSNKEIADKLGISMQTVYNHLVTTHSFLEKNLNNGLLINGLFISLFL